MDRSTPEGTPGFWTIARRRDIAGRALRTALVVGTILAAINHADALLRADIDATRLLKIALTYGVPYAVATWAGARAIQAAARARSA